MRSKLPLLILALAILMEPGNRSSKTRRQSRSKSRISRYDQQQKENPNRSTFNSTGKNFEDLNRTPIRPNSFRHLRVTTV
jgi:hypothetical protein